MSVVPVESVRSVTERIDNGLEFESEITDSMDEPIQQT